MNKYTMSHIYTHAYICLIHAYLCHIYVLMRYIHIYFNFYIYT